MNIFNPLAKYRTRRLLASLDSDPSPKSYLLPKGVDHYHHNYHWNNTIALDLFADKGTPLLAVRNGTTYVKDYSEGGHSVLLVDEFGYAFYHAHLVPGSGKQGKVTVGEQIGLVGNSGNAESRPSHCHLAIASDRKKIVSDGSGDILPWKILNYLEKSSEDKK